MFLVSYNRCAETNYILEYCRTITTHTVYSLSFKFNLYIFTHSDKILTDNISFGIQLYNVWSQLSENIKAFFMKRRLLSKVFFISETRRVSSLIFQTLLLYEVSRAQLKTFERGRLVVCTEQLVYMFLLDC